MGKIEFKEQFFSCERNVLSIQSSDGSEQKITLERHIPKRLQSLIDLEIICNEDELPEDEWPYASFNAIVDNGQIISVETWQEDNYLSIYDLEGKLKKQEWLGDMVGHGDIAFGIRGVVGLSSGEVVFYGNILDVPLLLFVEVNEDGFSFYHTTKIGQEGNVIAKMKSTGEEIAYITMASKQVEFGTFIKYSSENFSKQQKFYYRFKDYDELDSLFRIVDSDNHIAEIISDEEFSVSGEKDGQTFELKLSNGSLMKKL